MSKQLDYYKRNKEKVLKNQKIHRQKRRMRVISYYTNNKNCCSCCGEKTYEFLSIDHIVGGGTKHRKETGVNVDRWIINNNFPIGFDILCQNCNFAKGLYGKCPHKE